MKYCLDILFFIFLCFTWFFAMANNIFMVNDDEFQQLYEADKLHNPSLCALKKWKMPLSNMVLTHGNDILGLQHIAPYYMLAEWNLSEKQKSVSM